MPDLQRGACLTLKANGMDWALMWKPFALLTADKLLGRMPMASPGHDGQLSQVVMRCLGSYSALVNWLVNAHYGKKVVGAEYYATRGHVRLADGDHLPVRQAAAIPWIRRGTRNPVVTPGLDEGRACRTATSVAALAPGARGVDEIQVFPTKVTILGPASDES